MPQTCPRCSRHNPPEALFCFNDGAALGDPGRRLAGVDPARRRFPMPFVFPDGKACHSFDELVLACLDQWKVAAELLGHGMFAGFFAGLGRSDLVAIARRAAGQPDQDRGLDELLGQLPTTALQPPRLAVEPGQFNLGALEPGQDTRFVIHLSNQGMGLVQGSVSALDAPWLFLGEANTRSRKKLFQFLHETTLTVQVFGRALNASNKPREGRLVVESNAGSVTVPVRLEVPVRPFPEGPLAGATTPRQVAQLARDHPREAADLFARGAVARWYAANGWTYPVQEPSASGVAAVQQFFEALGLTKPPRVGINISQIELEGRGGEIVRTSFQVVTPEKRPVYAHAVSDQPWLEVNEVTCDGRTATVHLRVPDVPDRPGETLHARLTVTANGRQRFFVPVRLAVSAASRSRSNGPALVLSASSAPPPPVRAHREAILEVLPVPERLPERTGSVSDRVPPLPPPPAPPPVRARVEEFEEPVLARVPEGNRTLLAVLPILFLALGLSVTLIRDIVAWARGPAGVTGGDPLAGLSQDVGLYFHDTQQRVQLSANGSVKPPPGQVVPTRPGLWEASMRFGLVVVEPDRLGRRKKLTFDQRGQTNNTVVRLDGHEWIFGERPFRSLDGQVFGDWPGRWLDRNARVDQPLREGRRSVWVYDAEKVSVAQTVGLVAGAQSGRIDTCLVHYRIDNQDDRSHTVGLRFLLDTFIGGNDGVPFLVPGRRQLCSTSMMFHRPEDVPDFIQALESDNLTSPGTIARIQLRLPGMETPSRVTLGAWPNPALGPMCRQEKTLWDVPVLPIKSLSPADSAVAIYWNDRSLAPGSSREVAFTYGLGAVSSSEGGGRLALTVGGNFSPGGEFTVTAYVNTPAPGQTVTLSLPEGFSLVSGQATLAVPLPGAGSSTSPVTWKVRSGPREGNYSLRVRSSTGVAQTQSVQIRHRGIFGS